MQPTYVFSYYKEGETVRLKHRPWWNLFGHDKIIHVLEWQRVALTLPEDEADLLKKWEQTPTQRLLFRLMGKRVSMVQLEHSPYGTGYIPTGHVTTEFTATSRTNLCHGDVPDGRENP